jgi:N-acetylglucosamine-6-phosphate deacetylase
MAFGWVTREQYERLERDNDNLKAEVSELRVKLEAELRAQIAGQHLSGPTVQSNFGGQAQNSMPPQPPEPILIAQQQTVAQVLELPAEPKKEEPLRVVPRPLSGIEVVTRAMNHRNLHQAKG